jgi:cyclopropane-fatty-acyl-phospholipid synthase
MKRSQNPIGNATSLLDALFARVPEPEFEVRLWDGTAWRADPGRPARFTMTIRDPAVLRRLVLARDEAELGEGYVMGRFDLDGDLEAVVPVAEAMLADPPSWSERLKILASALRLPSAAGPRSSRNDAAPRLRGRRHSPGRDRAAVSYHYDASNEFYRLFLDPRMVYSCAYFHSADEPLDVAQERKLDYVCRKLRLRPGERLLDIGCGWGALIMHAASRYGVLAEGITLSQNQASLARERIREAGLERQCTVRVMDYRELDEPEGFDKIASVGMFEHVGEAAMAAYFGQAQRLIRPGGALLNHAIGGVLGEDDGGRTVADRWVFPDHELLPISVTLRGAEAAGLEVRDVENLREHYALTLRHWVRRLEARREEAIRSAGDATWRAWRLVFASAAHQFDAGKMHLYQALLVKPGPGGAAGVPLTRGDWY